MGGGVQVASSLISELANFEGFAQKISVSASEEVAASLASCSVDTSVFSSFIIHNAYGANLTAKKYHISFNTFGTVLTVFGPLYRWYMPFKNVVGFAQAWIIYPKNECYQMLSVTQRIKYSVKYWIQGKFFKRASVLIVELDHVKRRLIEVLGIPPDRIHVIRNCVSSIYLDESLWQPVEVPKLDGYIRLGFLGRNYVHKNTKLFIDVAEILDKKFDVRVKFYVTFTDEEWEDCSSEFHAVCINVGQLAGAQCPLFYKALDGMIFPSLLECFSAMPLETMVMGKPLFASDRPFNRDVCGSHAYYFDPLSPASAAQEILKVFQSNGPDVVALRAAREYAINFGSARERAQKYLDLLLGD